jgi:adenosylmethionine-8-amino-7-oxononanoate aminotransferase
MTGMGRTGRAFAVEHWNIAPDILVTAKGLSSGYAPLGAVLVTRKVVDAIADGSGAFLHGFTYNSHPISVAAGRAVLAYIEQHQLVVAANSDHAGAVASELKEKLSGLRSLDAVGEVRGIGLLWGVEFVAEKQAKRPFPPANNFAGQVAQAAMRRGVLVYPVQGCVDGTAGDHILIAPPAITTKEQVAWSVEQLRSAIEESTHSTART